MAGKDSTAASGPGELLPGVRPLPSLQDRSNMAFQRGGRPGAQDQFPPHFSAVQEQYPPLRSGGTLDYMQGEVEPIQTYPNISGIKFIIKKALT